MNYLKKIIEASNIISFDSDLMMKKNDEWINFIEPLFIKKFPKWEYRYEYENLYSIPEIRQFLKFQRKRFDKKFNFLIYLINNDYEILDNNFNWNDSILDNQDKYALFNNLEECKKYKYNSIGIITFLK